MSKCLVNCSSGIFTFLSFGSLLSLVVFFFCFRPVFFYFFFCVLLFAPSLLVFLFLFLGVGPPVFVFGGGIYTLGFSPRRAGGVRPKGRGGRRAANRGK